MKVREYKVIEKDGSTFTRVETTDVKQLIFDWVRQMGPEYTQKGLRVFEHNNLIYTFVPTTIDFKMVVDGNTVIVEFPNTKEYRLRLRDLAQWFYKLDIGTKKIAYINNRIVKEKK